MTEEAQVVVMAQDLDQITVEAQVVEVAAIIPQAVALHPVLVLDQALHYLNPMHKALQMVQFNKQDVMLELLAIPVDIGMLQYTMQMEML